MNVSCNDLDTPLTSGVSAEPQEVIEERPMAEDTNLGTREDAAQPPCCNGRAARAAQQDLVGRHGGSIDDWA